MSLRREPTYLSRSTWWALKIIADSWSDETHKVTADELADKFLSELINERYPSIVKFQKEVGKLERDIIKTLYGNTDKANTDPAEA